MRHKTGNVVAPFSVVRARRALLAACEASALDSKGAELIRLGENALFRLASSDTVVRIARTMDYWADAKKEVNVARWLADQNFPAAKVIEVPQPVAAAGHPATFWRFIPGRPGNQRDVKILGTLLRRLHEMPKPTTFKLPSGDILGRVRPRILTAVISARDKDFLLHRIDDISSRLPRLTYPLPAAVIHGDAHTENLMFLDNKPILIDFEQVAWGQPEWDLSLAATEYQTAKWWSESEYHQFVESYGYDVTSWTDGYEVLRATHELKMITWLMQNIGESKDISDEFQERMRTLRGLDPQPWRPF